MKINYYSTTKSAFNTLFLLIGGIYLISCLGKSDSLSVIPCHSHNDYEHTYPLYDALSCHFKSIEADVFSVGDSLFVAHNFEDIKPGRTLRTLYLNPLKNQIKKNKGSVYGNGEEIILFVDIKDDGIKTYQLLDKILRDYSNDITSFSNGEKKTRSIMVVVSGNRPFNFMQSQNIRYAGYDGRLENLDSGISPEFMPVVSDNWAKYFSWNGTGEMPNDERQELQNFADKAKNKGYILRFWGTPNKTAEQRNAVWTELRNAEVGLIGADNLEELKQFFEKQ